MKREIDRAREPASAYVEGFIPAIVGYAGNDSVVSKFRCVLELLHVEAQGLQHFRPNDERLMTYCDMSITHAVSSFCLDSSRYG